MICIIDIKKNENIKNFSVYLDKQSHKKKPKIAPMKKILPPKNRRLHIQTTFLQDGKIHVHATLIELVLRSSASKRA